MRTKIWLALMLYPMVNAVLFGLKIVPVLAVPALQEMETVLFPVAVASSAVLAAPIAWLIATRIRREEKVARRLAPEGGPGRAKAFTPG